MNADLTTLIASIDLPAGIQLSHEVVTDVDDELEAVIVRLYGLPGVTWGDEVEDLVDLAPAGFVLTESGGIGGPSIIGGVTYGGGTYTRWEPAGERLATATA